MAKTNSKKVKRGLARSIPEREDDIQAAVVAHLTLRCPPICYWFHVPNGGSRHVVEAAKFKRMGVRAGVADLVLVIGGKAHFLELKTSRGKQSASQVVASSMVERAGGVYAVARGVDEALGTLEKWGALAGARPR